MFCAMSVLGISWEHPTHPNVLACSVYQFHVYFHLRIIHYLRMSLQQEDGL